MLTVKFYGGRKDLILPTDSDQNIEDVIVAAARLLEINPICRHLAGLRDTRNKLWVGLSKKLSSLPDNLTVYFRLRFKAHSLDRLKYFDERALEYFFHQVRADFVASDIPEVLMNAEDCLGLVVTDILLHLISNPGQKLKEVDLRSFMPREHDGLAYRQCVKNNVSKRYDNWKNKEPSYVRERYLSTVMQRQSSLCTEEYRLQMDEAGRSRRIRLVVDGYHPEMPGLRYCSAQERNPEWNHLCRLEELVFVSMRAQDLTVEVARETGVPCYFKLSSLEELESFVGCLSGYYRLIHTWTFDLCRELSTPSLTNLRSNKCHGPIGSYFSYKKLKEKGGGEVGVGLVRESSTEYNTYLLDVILESGKRPTSYTIIREAGKVHIQGSGKLYDSIAAMVKDFIKNANSEIKLSRLLPPSDYDDVEPLLLCASRDKQTHSKTQTGPRIISMEHLTSDDHSIIKGRFSDLIRAQWTMQEDIQVAVKHPRIKKSRDSDEFLTMLNKFSFVSCECIVNIFGVTLSPLSLVMEYLPLGSLDRYLQVHKDSMKEVELVEAATYLARALWYLNMENVRHNNIRCHNLLVAEHSEQNFKVKLADPGLVKYTQQDLHWIPREHHIRPLMALQDPTTDIWAFSTTLWQIFSFGQFPLPGADMEEVRQLYETGRLLPRPDSCPQDLYKVMLRCWSPEPQTRGQPQAIMRDVNQILYQVFNSRKRNAYQTIFPATTASEENIGEQQNGELGEDEENGSITTQLTTLTLCDGSSTEVTLSQLPDNIVDDLISIGSSYSVLGAAYAGVVPELSPTNIIPSPSVNQKSPKKKLSEMLLPLIEAQRIPDLPRLPSQPLQLDKSDLRVGMKIGEGNYGEVYRGVMRDPQGGKETVAIKILKAVGQIDDLKREINIMKKLKHKNIVRLCGLVESEGEELYMVMEYLPLGSLKTYIITNKDHLKTAILLKFAMDIAEGMDYLEQCRIIHRDLAARNILVADKNTVKISDFGLAQEPNKGNYYFLKTERALPLGWYALECIERGQFSHKSDVWSFGVTCWEMFTHGLEPDLPQKTDKLLQLLRNGNRLNLKPPCRPNIYSKLIRPCWDYEPAMRPNFSAIIALIRELQEEL